MFGTAQRLIGRTENWQHVEHSTATVHCGWNKYRNTACVFTIRRRRRHMSPQCRFGCCQPAVDFTLQDCQIDCRGTH